MRKEELVILLLCCTILFFTGALETMYMSVLPFVILKNNMEITKNNTNISIDNSTSIYNHNISMDAYINKALSFSVSVKYITRVGFGPIPGMLIDKYGCLIIIVVGLTIQSISIIISFFSYHRILIHSVMRIFDAGGLVCMNTSSFALIWIVFHTKGTHPIYLGVLNMLYTFGTFVAPYIGTFLDSYLGFIYLPILTVFIFIFCLSFWIYIFISSKRNQKYIDIIYNTATVAHECTLKENSNVNLSLNDQINRDDMKTEPISNNELEILTEDVENEENINDGECDQNQQSQSLLKEGNKDKDLNTECENDVNESDKLIQEKEMIDIEAYDEVNKQQTILSNDDNNKENSNDDVAEPNISQQKFNDNANTYVSGDIIQINDQLPVKKRKIKQQKVTICSFFLFFRLLCNPYVFVCFLGIFTSQMSVTLFSSTLIMWMIDNFKVSQQKAGIVYLPGSILSLIVPIVFIVVFKRWSKIRYLGTLSSTLMQGIACLILPFYPQFWNVAFTILFSVNNILMNEYVYFPMIFDIITDKYGAELSGRSSIITNMAVSSGMLFGGLIGGSGVNLIGFRNFYISIGVFYICVSFLNIIMKKYST